MLETTLFLMIVEPRIFIINRRSAVCIYFMANLLNTCKTLLLAIKYLWTDLSQVCGHPFNSDGLESSRLWLATIYYLSVNLVLLVAFCRSLAATASQKGTGEASLRIDSRLEGSGSISALPTFLVNETYPRVTQIQSGMHELCCWLPLPRPGAVLRPGVSAAAVSLRTQGLARVSPGMVALGA